jgi:ankyrin repeat protein
VFYNFIKSHGRILGMAVLVMFSLYVGSCASAEVKGARDGDLNAVKDYVESGGDVNARQDRGMTLLMYASAGGHVHIIEYLMTMGADIRLKDDRGYTALIHGVESNKMNSLESLLSFGASVNDADNSGRTSLLMAASRNNHAMVSTLLARGADYNQADNKGLTPLMAALVNSASSSSGVTRSFTLLKDAGAPILSPSPLADSIAFTAMKSGNRDVLTLLFKAGTDPGISDGEGNTLLHYSVNDPQMIRFILDFKPGLNSRNKAGETPLFSAVKGNYPESTSLLIAEGADFNIADNKGWSPIMTALMQSAANPSGLTPSFSLLQERRAPLSIPSSQADSIATTAIKSGNREVLDVLFMGGLDPNISDSEGNTFLHLSVKNPDLLSFFLKYDINVNSKNARGESPLFAAVRGGYYESVTLLLDKGADPELRNNEGVTVLLLAAEKKSAQILNTLLLRDVNIFVTDKQGNTALHKASQMGVAESVRKLLLAGIFVNSTNSSGAMPYDLSFQNKEDGEEIRSILVTAGAIVPKVETPAATTPATTTPAATTPAATTPAATTPAATTPAATTPAATTPETTTPAATTPAATTPAPQDRRIVFSWPRINPSRAQGWNNSDKITSEAILTLSDESGKIVFTEKIVLPMKGANADAYQMERTLPLMAGKKYEGLFIVTTSKGKSLSSKVVSTLSEAGLLDLYFEEFDYN